MADANNANVSSDNEIELREDQIALLMDIVKIDRRLAIGTLAHFKNDMYAAIKVFSVPQPKPSKRSKVHVKNEGASTSDYITIKVVVVKREMEHAPSLSKAPPSGHPSDSATASTDSSRNAGDAPPLHVHDALDASLAPAVDSTAPAPDNTKPSAAQWRSRLRPRNHRGRAGRVSRRQMTTG